MENPALAALDRRMISHLNNKTSNSDVFKQLLLKGLSKPSVKNCIYLMTTSGAKGSVANLQQITSYLGQQELEGKRVPQMVSGKTLPCFHPWDWSSQSGGFIIDRFLTGLHPQEYYFHCMVGREGPDCPVRRNSKPLMMRLTELPSALKDKAQKFVHDLSLKEESHNLFSQADCLKLMEHKYLCSLAQPGEPVGVLAARSVGEPSTQMMLNTFHLAGRGQMNVTLGIPHLQEILMTAANEIKTPVMACPLQKGRSKEEAQHLADKLKKITVEAAYHGQTDDLETPSARICLGLPVKVGTGCFDLMHKIEV